MFIILFIDILFSRYNYTRFSREICEENNLICSPNFTSFSREKNLFLVQIYILFLFILWNMYYRIKTLNDNITTDI